MALSPRLRKPAPLRKGGRVAVLAISSPSEADRITAAATKLERAGLHVDLAPNLYERNRTYLAGDDATRLALANEALRSDRHHAFLFTRGGYGAMRILDAIDYEAIRRNPRPIIGYSDITALHQAVACAGVGSFHGPMLNTDFFQWLSPAVEDWFWNVLGGAAPLSWPIRDEQILAPGNTEGVLFGGCLSLTTALLGTPYDFWIDDGIWFWEDVSEPAYRIDRMLTTLQLSGRFRSLRGVMIGRLKECGGGEAADLDRLLSGFFADAGIPVLRDLPFGHFGDNLLLPIGTRARIDTSSNELTLIEPAVDVARGAR
jgi:muramoyltetrapeptide carboxypeptidase